MWTRRSPASSTSNRRQRRGELLDRDAALHPRQRGAEAAVHAVAEPDRDARRAFDVEVVGLSNARGSRVAAPVMSSTGKPAGMRAALEGRGPRPRTGPGTATAAGSAGSPRPRWGSCSGSSRIFCHWSGWRANSTTALPTSFVTVSAPAPPSRLAKPAISTSSSPVSTAVAAVDRRPA